MASNVLNKSPQELGEVFRSSKLAIKRRGETETPVTYSGGSPVKRPDGVDRFAGDIFGNPPQGVRSPFARAISDPKNKEAQEAMFDFTNQLFSGPFAPGEVLPLGEGPSQGGTA